MNERAHLDLFSGIGGFALAAQWCGLKTIAFSEIDPYASAVLKKHWPEVPNLGDIKTADWSVFRDRVYIVTGGFPCQDISSTGSRVGLMGNKSSLWFSMLNAIERIRPLFCLVENSPDLRIRGADVVLSGLERAGYSARTFVVGAVHAGAPHKRRRAWIVAHTIGNRWKQDGSRKPWASGEVVSDATGAQRRTGLCETEAVKNGHEFGNGCRAVSDAHGQQKIGVAESRPQSGHWAVEPDVGRVAHGIPSRLDRIRGLGNSIVPRVAYEIIRAMIEAEEQE